MLMAKYRSSLNFANEFEQSLSQVLRAILNISEQVLRVLYLNLAHSCYRQRLRDRHVRPLALHGQDKSHQYSQRGPYLLPVKYFGTEALDHHPLQLRLLQGCGPCFVIEEPPAFEGELPSPARVTS